MDSFTTKKPMIIMQADGILLSKATSFLTPIFWYNRGGLHHDIHTKVVLPQKSHVHRLHNYSTCLVRDCDRVTVKRKPTENMFSSEHPVCKIER